MRDLLAKCDWDEDELHVELPQWPEVVTVWVRGKAMPYVPVVTDSKCDTCEAMLDCDECLRADASHKELRGLQAEIKALHELVRDITEAFIHGNCYRWCEAEPCNFIIDGKCQFLDRMRELGVKL